MAANSGQRLLDAVLSPAVFQRLRACLLDVPVSGPDAYCKDEQLRHHALQVLQALESARPSDPPQFAVRRIDDDFFTDLDGGPVSHADYAFVQMVGPEGPVHHDTVRLGLSCQGEGLSYLGHHHDAVELYFVLEGNSLWWTDSAPGWELRGRSFHRSGEHHAMKTPAGQGGALYFWSWTGEIPLHIKHSGQPRNSSRM